MTSQEQEAIGSMVDVGMRDVGRPQDRSGAAMRWRRGRGAAASAAVVAAALFVLLGSVSIGKQGPYYDELHQAAGAFTWTGAKPSLFCRVSIDGWCVLNMSYSGAIKTNLYGAYLRLTAAPFTLKSWRRLALWSVAVGLAGFGVLASRTLGPAAMAVACLFVVLDTSVLLMSRFDWGPVALGAALRLLLLGTWLSMRPGDAQANRARFAFGLLCGLATFEKLSSSVLLPLAPALMFLDARAGERVRAAAAAASGVAVGLLPLVALNVRSYLRGEGLVSLADTAPAIERSWAGLQMLFAEYLKLGQGGAARGFTLAAGTDPRLDVMETALMLATSLLVVAIGTGAASSGSVALRRGALCMLAYWMIGLELFFLPKETWVHHWIIGTPFQYVGVALCLQGLLTGTLRRRHLALGGTVLVGAIAVTWLATRLPTMIQTIAAVRSDTAGLGFDRSFKDLGRFAARKSSDAVFVASTWGVGLQIHSYAGGKAGLVEEIFWNYRDADDVDRIWRESGKRELWVVGARLHLPAALDVASRLDTDVAADRRWQPIATPEEFRDASRLTVRGFVRSE